MTTIAEDSSREHISVGDLLAALRDRAMGALIFAFAFPNVVPLPPGASSVLGAPLLFLTAQLALGRRPWLPSLIARRSIERTHFAALVKRMIPWLARAERLLRPRLGACVRAPAEYVIGVICFMLAVILFLPIPFGNMPPAIAICIFALALLEGDGAWALLGCCAAAAAIAIVWTVLFGLLQSAAFFLAKSFG